MQDPADPPPLTDGQARGRIEDRMSDQERVRPKLRAGGGVLDVVACAFTSLLVLDLATTLGASWPAAAPFGVLVPTVLWGALESRGPGSIGRFVTGAAIRRVDGRRLGLVQGIGRQAPVAVPITLGIVLAPGFALLVVALAAADLLAVRHQPDGRSLRDRWIGSIVLTRHAARAAERAAQ